LRVTTLETLLTDVDAMQDEIVELTQALVRVPSVNTAVMPTGNETPAAVVLRDKLAAADIAGEIFESAPNRGNLVARMRGTGEAPSLMLMGHVDVVPVEDETQWTHEPFSGEVAQGRIWGRGSADMKSTVAAEAMTAILLKRRGLPLRGDLVLAAGADEESGGAYGFGWLAQHHPEAIRADFAVNEGGGAPLKRNGQLTYPINVGEKGRLEIRITVTGRGYHASAPWMADNAIYRAQPVLDRIAAYKPAISADADIFRHLDAALGIAEPVTDDNVDQIVNRVMANDTRLGSWLRAASRMTIVASMIRAGVKSNSVAESCLITCDVRTLPWQDESYVARELDRILDGLDGVRYEIITTAVPSASPFDTPLADQIAAAMRATLGQDKLAFIPGLTTGFTDSRLVRPLGIVAYGFAPSHPDSDTSLNGAHNIDESIAIADVMTMTRMFTALSWQMLVDVRA
jgi:acetylornithine deacetylase/succinyl-diaminopimelate desuccinylase-like protein